MAEQLRQTFQTNTLSVSSEFPILRQPKIDPPVSFNSLPAESTNFRRFPHRRIPFPRPNMFTYVSDGERWS